MHLFRRSQLLYFTHYNFWGVMTYVSFFFFLLIHVLHDTWNEVGISLKTGCEFQVRAFQNDHSSSSTRFPPCEWDWFHSINLWISIWGDLTFFGTSSGVQNTLPPAAFQCLMSSYWYFHLRIWISSKCEIDNMGY